MRLVAAIRRRPKQLIAAAIVGAVVGGRGCEIDGEVGSPTAYGGSVSGTGVGTPAGGSGGSSTTTTGTPSGTAGGDVGGAGGGEPEPFSFFAIGDPRSNWDVFESNARSMVQLDPDAIAVFSIGDLTPYGAASEWDEHHQALADGAPDPSVPTDPSGIVRQSHFRTDVSTWGPYSWYLGIMGNHDDGDGNWFANWNDYLVGQQGLGVNAADGIYYSLSYRNALFIALDSINDSSEQTAWLEGVLTSAEGVAATWKLAFFHSPVYPCNYKSPFDNGLDWVTLFEQHGVDIVFVADSHTYERSCPMVGGSCAPDGVIYLNTSGAGAGTRDVEATRVETLSHGGRTDTYDCAAILQSYQGNWHHFSHIVIEGCTLILRAYDHDWYQTQKAPFDELVIDKCSR